MITQQSAARSTSSNTNLFVRYVPTRPLALDRQTTTATESGTTATTKHTAYISPKSLLGEKTHQTMRYRDECMPLTGFFHGYCLLATTFAWRSLTIRGTIIFSLVFCVENVFPVFLYTLPPCHKICHRPRACCV